MQDSYLQKLSFDPALKRNFMATLLQAPRLLFLVIFSLILAGVYAYITLPRELTPEIEIPIVTVSTALPGANPLDVEELVTNKLEKEINSLTDIDSIESSSSEGFSSIVVTFDGGVDADKKVTEVKEKVDLVTDLPEDATVPRVAKIDFNAQPVLQVALVGDTDIRSLTKIAEKVQDELELLSSVRTVSVTGGESEEIVISVDQEVLRTYGLSSNQISQAISNNNITFPVGSIQVNDTEYQLSVDSAVSSIEQLRSIPIQTQGQSVLLGDIANIYFQAVASDAVTSYASEQTENMPISAVQMSIFKTASATIIDTADEASLKIDEVLTSYPQVRSVTILDNGQDIDDQFGDLAINFRDTIGLVFLTLFVFIGLRQAVVASVSIPLTFLSTFVIMQIVGISLNFLSLFSLLLALGLVVDDAIVIVEATYRYNKKFSPLEAGLLVFRDFVVPIWTTTLTTVWAFLPLLLATGIIGEFIKSIPVVVSATLMSSTAIAVFINLPLIVTFTDMHIPKRVKWLGWFLVIVGSISVVFALTGNSTFAVPAVIAWIGVLAAFFWTRHELRARSRGLASSLRDKSSLASRSSKKSKNFITRFSWLSKGWSRVSGFASRAYAKRNNIIEHGIIDFSVVTDRYRSALEYILIRRWARFTVYGVSVAFFVLSIIFLVTGLLKNEFFPQTDVQQIYVNIEGPSGWPLENTLPIMRSVEQTILEYPEVKHVVSQTNSLFAGDFSGGQSGPHLAYVTIVLKDPEDRTRTSMDISEDLRDSFEEIVEAKVSVVEVSGGPPVGADLEVSIVGNDMAELEQVSNDFMDIIRTIPGAVNIDSTLKQNAGQIKVIFNPVALQSRGLSVIQVAGSLRAAVTGSETGDITIAEEDISIIVRYPEEELTLSRLQNLVLEGPTGSYSLAEVAHFELATSPISVSHIDLDRVIQVGAAAEGVSAPELLAAFEEKVADYDLPAGVTWSVGGANQENTESTLSIIRAMGLSVILILVTMVLQLNSFRKSLMVLLVIPLAVAGVFFNFTLLGVPLSFAALIGVLALFGIVVNNSIMLIEKINQNIRFKLPFLDAIASACSSRIEAIFFTSLTTTMGLLPITIADPFWRGLGGAIIAGLTVSGLLILFLLPTVYYEMYSGSEEAKQ